LRGQDAADLGEYVEQAGVEAIEHAGWQVGEQLAREPTVTVKECLGSSASPFGEGDECRTAVSTVEYVSHEFYRIADGLVAEEWICSDMATLLGQLS
jgi:hypothetical protein